MNKLFKKKEYCISLLQQYNGWGKENLGLLDVLVGSELSSEIEATTVATNILINTNKIISPIQLENSVELPVVELFIDIENFVVFTTQCIYNCRKTIIEKIEYLDIIKVDSNSLTQFLLNKSTTLHFGDIELILSNGTKVIVVFEYGISFRPLVYFLTMINDNGEIY